MADNISGELHVANEVLAEMAGRAVQNCYGVIGMASARATDGIVRLLPISRNRRGVVVNTTEDGVHVDMYIIVEYGTNINVVSQNVVEAVTFALGNYACVPIAGVDVHVKGVKVSK